MFNTSTQIKKSIAVPIRLSMEEKYILEEFSKEAKLPLSTYIKTKLNVLIAPRLKKLKKTHILLQKIKAADIPDKDIDLALNMGKDFRKKFKLTQE